MVTFQEPLGLFIFNALLLSGENLAGKSTVMKIGLRYSVTDTFTYSGLGHKY